MELDEEITFVLFRIWQKRGQMVGMSKLFNPMPPTNTLTRIVERMKDENLIVLQEPQDMEHRIMISSFGEYVVERYQWYSVWITDKREREAMENEHKKNEFQLTKQNIKWFKIITWAVIITAIGTIALATIEIYRLFQPEKEERTLQEQIEEQR